MMRLAVSAPELVVASWLFGHLLGSAAHSSSTTTCARTGRTAQVFATHGCAHKRTHAHTRTHTHTTTPDVRGTCAPRTFSLGWFLMHRISYSALPFSLLAGGGVEPCLWKCTWTPKLGVKKKQKRNAQEQKRNWHKFLLRKTRIDSVNTWCIVFFPVLKPFARGRQSRCRDWTYKLPRGQKFSIKLSPLSIGFPQRRPLN